MGKQLQWHPNALFLPVPGKPFWRIFQTLQRRNFLVTRDFFPVVDTLSQGATSESLLNQFPATVEFCDASEFSIWRHCHSNTAFFNESSSPVSTPLSTVIEELLDAGVIYDSEKPPWMTEKRGFLDPFRGNYHEQIGSHALSQRQSVETWWASQKFEDDFRSTRAIPYRYIQDHFLQSYIPKIASGKRVLEVGCGTGYYSNQIASHAKHTVGLDYSKEYIRIARERWSDKAERLEFVEADITSLTSDVFGGEAFDAIFIIDTFLFLFDRKFQPALFENRFRIMGILRELLHESGTVVIMDPHPFWLTPWIGSEQYPVGVLSEYRNRRFKVVPSLGEVSELFASTGFSIRQVHEPSIDEAYKKIDPQAYAFMAEFPQWWVFELNKSSF